MISAPLPSPEQEGERLLLEPAWLGRKPTNARPLTDEWYTGVTQPHYHADGSITFVLTPPRDRGSFGVWLRVLGILAVPATVIAVWRFYGWL